MTVDFFSGAVYGADRRRRRMATEIDPDLDLSQNAASSDSRGSVAEFAAFPMLSRDRLIRRVISPRLWKHIAAAFLLTLTPVFYATLTWPSADSSAVPDDAQVVSRLQTLKGLSGLKLFVAAQLCLLIAWVRSASAVDFRGRYRWWRWMAVGLFSVSLTLLTNSGVMLMDAAADSLEPVFGHLDAARPALIFVPAAACLALLLWRLIPDMGRCRISQRLLVLSIVLLVARAFAGAREYPAVTAFHLSVLELLVSGLMLSALQLHARFVIHVNPNPPIVLQRESTKINTAESDPSANAASVLNAVVAQSATIDNPEHPDAAVSLKCSPTFAAESVPVQDSVSLGTAPTPDQATAEIAPFSSNQPPTKGKAGKKQKHRKAA